MKTAVSGARGKMRVLRASFLPDRPGVRVTLSLSNLSSVHARAHERSCARGYTNGDTSSRRSAKKCVHPRPRASPEPRAPCAAARRRGAAVLHGRSGRQRGAGPGVPRVVGRHIPGWVYPGHGREAYTRVYTTVSAPMAQKPPETCCFPALGSGKTSLAAAGSPRWWDDHHLLANRS